MMMMMIMSMIITDDFGEGEVKHTRGIRHAYTQYVYYHTHTTRAREPDLCGRGGIAGEIFSIEN